MHRLRITPTANASAETASAVPSIPLPPTVPLSTFYPDYELTEAQANRTYYKEIKARALSASGVYRFDISVSESRRSIVVRDGSTIVFKCSKYGTAPRCVLLELHDCGYNIPAWLKKRNEGGFDNWNYKSIRSPPSESL